MACAGCGFPGYTADLDDGTVDDAELDVVADGLADADADVSPLDSFADVGDAHGDTATDALADAAECDPDAEAGGLDASSCTTCALSKCSSEVMNCQSTVACKAFIDCTATCRCETVAKCFLDCRAAHPSPEADALQTCLATSCAAECGG